MVRPPEMPKVSAPIEREHMGIFDAASGALETFGTDVGSTGDSSSGQEQEIQRLRAALEQREAAFLRQEGENFLLGAQVQQLEQQAAEANREAAQCYAQLAQTMSLLDAVACSRTPVKAEVDRARALVAGARRGLRRLAQGSGGGGGGTGAAEAAAARGSVDRRPSPKVR